MPALAASSRTAPTIGSSSSDLPAATSCSIEVRNAPLAATWGVDNRTVSLRVPCGPANSRHIEHRICGADANPYLAMAGTLACGLLGIRDRLQPMPAMDHSAQDAGFAASTIPLGLSLTRKVEGA